MADLGTVLGVGMDKSALYEEIIRENLDKRILVVNDEITEAVMSDYILYILKWNREDKGLPVENRKPITVYVNSPGGSTFDGFSVVDILLQSKTPVNTVCFALGASMGYHIFLAGKERFVFKRSCLLQHDGELTISNSSSKAKDTMKFFEAEEKRTKDYVLSRTTMTEEFYDKVYEQEYWMSAEEAKELGVATKIIGVDCTLDDIL